jgi:S-formylglutathione hydrolase
MNLNLYLPPQANDTTKKVPVLFYLAGLTCTGDNGAEKGFFQYGASQKGIAVVYPDTSPREWSPTSAVPISGQSLKLIIAGGLGIKGEDDDWDFGTGAGF